MTDNRSDAGWDVGGFGISHAMLQRRLTYSLMPQWSLCFLMFFEHLMDNLDGAFDIGPRCKSFDPKVQWTYGGPSHCQLPMFGWSDFRLVGVAFPVKKPGMPGIVAPISSGFNDLTTLCFEKMWVFRWAFHGDLPYKTFVNFGKFYESKSVPLRFCHPSSLPARHASWGKIWRRFQ